MVLCQFSRVSNLPSKENYLLGAYEMDSFTITKLIKISPWKCVKKYCNVKCTYPRKLHEVVAIFVDLCTKSESHVFHKIKTNKKLLSLQFRK